MSLVRRVARVALGAQLRRLVDVCRAREARQQAIYASAFQRGLALSKSLKRHPNRTISSNSTASNSGGSRRSKAMRSRMLGDQPLRRGLFTWRSRHLGRLAERDQTYRARRHHLLRLGHRAWRAWRFVVEGGRFLDMVRTYLKQNISPASPRTIREGEIEAYANASLVHT